MKTTQGYIIARRGRFFGRYQLNGKRFEFVLRDEVGKPVTSQRAAQKALDVVMAPLRLKATADRIAMYARQAEGLRERIVHAERENSPDNPTPQNLPRLYPRFLGDQTGDSRSRLYIGRLARLAGFMQEHQIKTLEDFSKEQARQFMSAHQNTPTAHNEYKQLIIRLWKRLYDEEIITRVRCPFALIPNAFERKKAKRLLSAAEVGRLINAASGEWRTLFIIGALSGLRLKDACLLEWPAVDFAAGVLRIQQAKLKRHGGRAGAIIGIAPQLEQALRQCKQEGQYVLPEIAQIYLEEERKNRLMALSRRLKVIFDAAKVENATFHCLRHYYISAMIAAGAPAAIVQKMAGHNSAAMTAHYTHVAADTARKYAAGLTLDFPASGCYDAGKHVKE